MTVPGFITLLFPVFLFLLVRGWFFAANWRRHRIRNTIILVMLMVMVFPHGSLIAATVTGDFPDTLTLFFQDHIRERLARIYGGEENIPPLSPLVKTSFQPLPPPAGENNILREAALYFMPDRVRVPVKKTFTRWAKALNLWDDAVRTALDVAGPREAQAWSSQFNGCSRMTFFHPDHLGSTRLTTDQLGRISERIDYSPFGEVFRDDMYFDGSGYSTTDPYDRTRTKFTGQQWDYKTGLYYYGARYYDPEVGRFTSADTIVPSPLNPQDYNRYSYVRNNPMKYTDPSGHSLSSFLAILGAAIIVGLALGTVGAAWGYIHPQTFGTNSRSKGARAGFWWGMGIGAAIGGFGEYLHQREIEGVANQPQAFQVGLNNMRNMPMASNDGNPSTSPGPRPKGVLRGNLDNLIEGYTATWGGEPPAPPYQPPSDIMRGGDNIPDPMSSPQPPSGNELGIGFGANAGGAYFNEGTEIGVVVMNGTYFGPNGSGYYWSGNRSGLSGALGPEMTIAIGKGSYAGKSKSLEISYGFLGASFFYSETWVGVSISVSLLPLPVGLEWGTDDYVEYP